MTEPLAAIKIIAFPIAAKAWSTIGNVSPDFMAVNEWGPIGILAAGCFYLESLRRRQAAECQAREDLAVKRAEEREEALLQDLREARSDYQKATEEYKAHLEELLKRCQDCR